MILLKTVVVFERTRLPTGGIEVRLPVLQTWLACISAHALARYFQRARDSSRAALLADLRALAKGTVGPGVTEIAAFGGIWLGSVIATKHVDAADIWVDSPFFARTFLAHDDRPDTDGNLI